MATRFSLPHIDITPFISSQDYQGAGTGGGAGVRDRIVHGQRVQQELDAALVALDAMRGPVGPLDPPTGSYLEVELRPGTKPDALDMKTENIRSGAAKIADNDDRVVALYVPDDARETLLALLRDYLTGPLTERGNPPNKAKVEAIEAFRAARMETLWTDDPAALPADADPPIWWAVWCWRGGEDQVVTAAERLNLRVGSKDRWLTFPESVVIPVLGDRRSIELMVLSTGAVAELRRANDTPAIFIDEIAGDQLAWAEDMAERVTWPPLDAPAVCLFDSGANRGHVLLEPALAPDDMHAISSDWGPDDHSDAGHGTAMAGMALHGDLTAPLLDKSERTLSHRLETVKILPPDGFDPNEPSAYGPITQAAVALPEIEAPDRRRVYCMAVTNLDVSGSRPSAWSAAIDQAAIGAMEGDDDQAPKRLIIIAAGNVTPTIDAKRLQPQDDYPVEDPAQAWNALTVGGYTDLIEVRDKGYDGWTPLVAPGELSPHSRTSVTWPRNAPFKPEIVMEAGNRAINAARSEILTLPSLSLCSTGKDSAKEPIVSFQATSAAAAQAARLAARLAADHPEFWPETIRALIVHSAEWTPPMIAALDGCRGKEARYEVIRRFGYGVPDYGRATASANHHLALFAQTEIQPFKLEGQRKFNECHYFELPIPRSLLEELENKIVQLRVTLSYFIDPNPGMSANIDPQRYQSHGLRFDLRRKGEPLETFKQRVNASEREDPRVGPKLINDDDRWTLGPKSVSAGSLHCDTWTGPAIELAGRDTLCIKPVGGWCRDRATREVCNTKRRYALIVTLKSSDIEVDLYTPIKTHIDALVDVEIAAGR